MDKDDFEKLTSLGNWNKGFEYITEMANIKHTGLPTRVKIWIDESGDERGNEHGGSPRLKIKGSKTGSGFNRGIPVLISKNPGPPPSISQERFNQQLREHGIYGDWQDIRKFISNHVYLLLKLWYNEIDLTDANDVLEQERDMGKLFTDKEVDATLKSLQKNKKESD